MAPASDPHADEYPAGYRAEYPTGYRAEYPTGYRAEYSSGDQATYDALLVRARRTVAGYPPLLRDLAEPLIPDWSEGSFSRIVALLPYWVADLLDQVLPREGRASPSRSEETETLALANLLGWWSHLIQDGILDQEPDLAELLPLSAALHASAIRLLANLLPNQAYFWEAFERYSLATSEACLWEQQLRLDTLDPVRLGTADQERIAARTSLLQLAVVAQFALRGPEQEHPLCTALAGMLRHYALARQIGDDRSDWARDLENGRLNYVSSRLARRMLATGAVASFAELDVERMMGYYLHDDELFASIQREAIEACRWAAQGIAPYGSQPLDSLVGDLAQQLERVYREALERRRALKAVFGPANEGCD
jgi:hypothetical protein